MCALCYWGNNINGWFKEQMKKYFGKPNQIRSHVLKASAELIDRRSTSWSTFDWHLDQYSVITRSIPHLTASQESTDFCRHHQESTLINSSVDSQSRVDLFLPSSVGQHSADYWLSVRCWLSVSLVSIRDRLRCWLSVDQRSMEGTDQHFNPDAFVHMTHQMNQWVGCQPIKMLVFPSKQLDENPNLKYNWTSLKTLVTVVVSFWNHL